MFRYQNRRTFMLCHAKAKKGKESENPYCEFRFIVKRVDCGPSDW